MISRKLLLSLTCAGALSLGVAACGSSSSGTSSSGGGGSSLSGEIAGAGSSAQEAAMAAWIAGLQNESPDVNASYDPVGSGGGREQFNAGGVVFAGTDSPFADAELAAAKKRCAPGTFIQIPVYISPIAVVYSLQGVDTLQLSPDTIASIFAQKISKWNDPLIAADNPGVKLPSTAITPVNRSDDSGTTNNFTDYLGQAAPSVWKFPASDTFPVKGGESAEGTSGVVAAVGAGDGTVGYADASQAGSLGIAKIKVGNKYVAPSAAGAAKIVDQSKDTVSDKTIFSFAINRTSTDPSTYPISLVSSQAGCTQYDKASDAAIVKALFNYIISPAGQKAAADNAGSAPMSASLQKQVQPVVDQIGG